MYAKTITLNQQPIACNATIKWYQNAVAGDAGSYYAAIMRGLYSKVFALTMKTLNAAIENNTTNGYIPSGLISDTVLLCCCCMYDTIRSLSCSCRNCFIVLP